MIGVESTILDDTTNPITLLRPGGTTLEDLEKVLGYRPAYEGGLIKAPGMAKKHYSPQLALRCNQTQCLDHEAFLGFGEISFGAYNLSETGNLEEAASRLFLYLHEVDDPQRFTAINVAPIPMMGLGLAINDRLERAAAQTDEA
jgi:L-threonylcarbamoyladenylate synthase